MKRMKKKEIEDEKSIDGGLPSFLSIGREVVIMFVVLIDNCHDLNNDVTLRTDTDREE